MNSHVPMRAFGALSGRSSLRARLATVALGSLTLLAPALNAALHTGDATPPGYKAFAWGYVVSGSPSNTAGVDLKIQNGSKESYLKFRVPEFTMTQMIDGKSVEVLAVVQSAKLRLRLKSGSAGVSTQVFAADNDWAKDALPLFGSKPRKVTPALNSALSPAPGTLVTIDLKNYISGKGEFTINLSSGGGELTYHGPMAAEGDQPELILTFCNHRGDSSADDYPQRDLTDNLNADIIPRGEAYIDRYSASGDITNYGWFDVTKQPYGAKGDNSTDDTYAIQRAINEARDARVAVYFPPGTYLVSDQLQCVQGRVDMAVVNGGPADGERWNHSSFPCVLIGDATTSPTLRLKSGATGFGAPATPKALLNFWYRNGDDTTNNPGGPWAADNKPASQFNCTLSNFNINLGGATNDGAIGVDMSAAQGAVITNVKITATGAYAGFQGVPAPGGGVYDVTVDGGKFGFRTASGKDAYTPIFVNSTFINQTDYSIEVNNCGGALVLVGVKMTKGINMNGSSDSFAGNLCLVDCIFDFAASTPAVTTNRSVYMNNVYFRNAVPILQHLKPNRTVPGGSGWKHVTELAAGADMDQAPKYGTTTLERVPYWDPTRRLTDLQEFGPPGVAPDDANTPTGLRARHKMYQLPDPTDGTKVVRVGTKTGGAIQTAINTAETEGKAVFLPRGDYNCTATINLKPGTVLFGVNKEFSRIKVNGLFTDATPSDPRPLMKSMTTSGTKNVIAEVTLFERMTDTSEYLLDWQNYSTNSFVQNVTFDRRNVGTSATMQKPLIKISGNGGGRWYNVWPITSSNQSATYRHLLITGTTKKLVFYMLNPETDVDGLAQVEIADSSNIDVYQTKWEGHSTNDAIGNTAIKMSNSNNVRFFGFGGSYRPSFGEERGAFEVTASTNFLFAMQSFQQNEPGRFADPKPTSLNYYIVKDGANTTPGDEQFTLYRRGTPTGSSSD